MIRKLSSETIALISAGEVITNTNNIIKELLENAIDAKSTRIEIIVYNKNKNITIKIIDNGKGIDYDDLRLITKRYHTSKVHHNNSIDNSYNDVRVSIDNNNIKDIENNYNKQNTNTTDVDYIFKDINTYGYRGEALSSISNIADIEIKSLHRYDNKNSINDNNKNTRVSIDHNKNDVTFNTTNIGYKCKYKNNNIISITPIAMNYGTTITISNIFYNLLRDNNKIDIENIILGYQILYPSIDIIYNSNYNYKYDMFNISKSKDNNNNKDDNIKQNNNNPTTINKQDNIFNCILKNRNIDTYNNININTNDTYSVNLLNRKISIIYHYYKNINITKNINMSNIEFIILSNNNYNIIISNKINIKDIKDIVIINNRYVDNKIYYKDYKNNKRYRNNNDNKVGGRVYNNKYNRIDSDNKITIINKDNIHLTSPNLNNYNLNIDDGNKRIVYVEIYTNDIDINIHPSKSMVLIRDTLLEEIGSKIDNLIDIIDNKDNNINIRGIRRIKEYNINTDRIDYYLNNNYNNSNNDDDGDSKNCKENYNKVNNTDNKENYNKVNNTDSKNNDNNNIIITTIINNKSIIYNMIDNYINNINNSYITTPNPNNINIKNMIYVGNIDYKRIMVQSNSYLLECNIIILLEEYYRYLFINKCNINSNNNNKLIDGNNKITDSNKDNKLINNNIITNTNIDIKIILEYFNIIENNKIIINGIEIEDLKYYNYY